MEALLHAEYLAFTILYNPHDPCSRVLLHPFYKWETLFQGLTAAGIQGDKQCKLNSEYSGNASFIHSLSHKY